MGRVAQVLTKSLLWPSARFWPQDWNGTTASLAAAGNQVAVTPESAMSVMAYYQGIRFWAQTVASLPLMVYKRLPDGGKQQDAEHPMYRILHDVANPEMTSFTWREAAMGHLVAWGNSFSERQLDGRGRTIALWPLRPDRMTVVRNDAGALVYRYTLPFPLGKIVELPAERVFHVRGLAYDGLIGYSPLEIMRRSLSLTLSAQEYGERTFQNDARPGVVYTHPNTLSETARTNLEDSIERNHQGLTNAQRFAVLEEGITVHDVGFPPEAAQFLGTRQFQVEEMARGLDLPPHVVGGMDRMNFSNIDQQAIDLVVHHVRPMLVRWEAQIGKDLIPETDHFAEFVIDGLLRGDPLVRAQKLWIERQGGALNADEWRALENRNPLPDGAGQAFLQPLNMTPLGAPAEGDQPEFIKPAVIPSANPDTTVIPGTAPIKPSVPSKNGRTGVPA